MEELANIGIMLLLAGAMFALAYLAIKSLDRWVFPGVNFEHELNAGNTAVGLVVGLTILGIFLFAGRATAAPTDQYDDSFRRWSKIHFGYQHHWTYFKAQAMTESAFRPGVCSHAGACGLMQFLAGTAREMKLADRFNPRASIRAGIAYDRRLWRIFAAEQGLERLRFALAAYNVGPGGVIRAQAGAERSGRPTDTFTGIAPHLPEETRNYVPRIERWQRRFRYGRGAG